MLGLKRAKRAKPGDIARLKVDENSWAKLQYLGRHEFCGPAVLVHPNLADDAGEIIRGTGLINYVVFYLFPDFVRDGLIEVVAYEPPQIRVPVVTRQRREITRVLRPCKSWIITDLNGQRTFRDDLTDDELAIPERMILSHETLLNRLRNGWQPMDEVIRSV